MPDVWTVIDILNWTTAYFEEHAIEDPRLSAELLLSCVLGLERLQLYLQYDRPLTDKERAGLKVMIRRRIAHEPVQYITGFTYFMGLKFFVSSAVLIPRFDTEILAEKAIELIGQHNISRVIDVGTGSGALAISMAHFVTSLRVCASDLSAEALAVAEKNAHMLNVFDRIIFREGDLLGPWADVLALSGPLLVVANLPYVRESEWGGLAPEVKDYEPKQALVSGRGGLEHYGRLLDQLASVTGTWYGLFELGIDQVTELKDMVAQKISDTEIKVIKDLAGNDRCFFVSKK